MSRIGNYALDIQGQANALGYSTIQEAFDNGYEVIDDTLAKIDSHDALAEQVKAHEAWLGEKEEVLGDLNNLLLGMGVSGKTTENSSDYAVVERAIRFIERGEV